MGRFGIEPNSYLLFIGMKLQFTIDKPYPLWAVPLSSFTDFGACDIGRFRTVGLGAVGTALIGPNYIRDCLKGPGYSPPDSYSHSQRERFRLSMNLGPRPMLRLLVKLWLRILAELWPGWISRLTAQRKAPVGACQVGLDLA